MSQGKAVGDILRNLVRLLATMALCVGSVYALRAVSLARIDAIRIAVTQTSQQPHPLDRDPLAGTAFSSLAATSSDEGFFALTVVTVGGLCSVVALSLWVQLRSLVVSLGRPDERPPDRRRLVVIRAIARTSGVLWMVVVGMVVLLVAETRSIAFLDELARCRCSAQSFAVPTMNTTMDWLRNGWHGIWATRYFCTATFLLLCVRKLGQRSGQYAHRVGYQLRTVIESMDWR
jgi:hypothetical protein